MASRKNWRIVFKFNNLSHGKTKAILPPEEFQVEEVGHDPGVAVQRAFNKLRKDKLKNLSIPDMTVLVKYLGKAPMPDWLIGNRKSPREYQKLKEIPRSEEFSAGDLSGDEDHNPE